MTLQESKQKENTADEIPTQTFIRWGYIPEDEHSRRNDRKTAGRHAGTSCYAASPENGKWRIHDQKLSLIGFETLHMLYAGKNPRPILLLTGTLVDNGPDNEPLIRKITILPPVVMTE